MLYFGCNSAKICHKTISCIFATLFTGSFVSYFYPTTSLPVWWLWNRNITLGLGPFMSCFLSCCSLYNLIPGNTLMWRTLLLTDLVLLLFCDSLSCHATSAPNTDVLSFFVIYLFVCFDATLCVWIKMYTYITRLLASYNIT